MGAKENLTPALISIVDDEIQAGAGETYGVRFSQKYCGVSYDRVRRLLVYSLCEIGTDTDGSSVNATGFDLYSGLHTIDAAATFDITNFKNWSIFTKSIDTDAVTQYVAWTAGSVVPNGVGPSTGSHRRFVEADYYTQQIPKLVDPRTGNVWSHHIVGSGLAPDISCLIYEFRRDEDYAQTISPYVPPDDYHLEILGITEDWVYVWQYFTDTLELLPRVRTAEEVAQDYLLSYASFAFPADFVAALGATRVTMGADGSIYLLTMKTSAAGARNVKLYKFTTPTSAPYGGPTVGGGFTEITPWTSSTGPNTSNGSYRGWLGSFGNTNILWRQPATDDLVCVTKRLPRQKYPTQSTDPNDLAFDCTYVHLDDMSFDYHGAFVTGYMTEAWETTDDPNEAAWAVIDCAEHDTDLAYHDYDFSDYASYTRRWFSFMCLPVVGGVIQGSYSGATPKATSTYRVLVEYEFGFGSAPAAVRALPEQPWDDRYAAYGTAIGNTEVVNYSMADGDANFNSYYDIGLWDAQTSSWWYSGNDGNVWDLNPAFTARSPYLNDPPFLRLSFSRNRGVYRIRYGDLF